MTGRTQRQDQVLAFIIDYKQNSGIPPSMQDIQHFMGAKSKSAAARVVDCLVARGAISKTFKLARSIEILDGMLCPHCGYLLASEKCRTAARNKVTYSSSKPSPPVELDDTTGGATQKVRAASGSHQPGGTYS